MEDIELPSDWGVAIRRGGEPPQDADADPDRQPPRKRARVPPAAPPPPAPTAAAPCAVHRQALEAPLGPRGVFDAASQDAPERGQLRDMVAARLLQPGPGGDAAPAAPPVDIDCLICKLPYKKMLSDLFGGDAGDPSSREDALRAPQIPYVTRAYEESFMREVVHPGERECAKGARCECMLIDPEQPFVGVEFLLPGERQPPTPHLCVLCCRAVTQQLYFDVMFDRQVLLPPPRRPP